MLPSGWVLEVCNVSLAERYGSQNSAPQFLCTPLWHFVQRFKPIRQRLSWWKSWYWFFFKLSCQDCQLELISENLREQKKYDTIWKYAMPQTPYCNTWISIRLDMINEDYFAVCASTLIRSVVPKLFTKQWVEEKLLSFESY